ncbi:MAG: S53 family peptidase [Caulobacteraceae bacterium]
MTDKPTVLSNSAHAVPATAKATRRTNPNRWLEITLGVKRRADLPDLSSLDMVPPGQRTYLSQDQMAEQYGADAGSVARIAAFAAAHAIEIVRTDVISARMIVGGTVAALSAAFGVTLFDYDDAVLGNFHARTGPVSLPPEIAADITGVFGFSNQRHLRRVKHNIAADQASRMIAGRRKWFVPTELAPIYNFPANDAAGQTIALLEFGGGVETADVTAYFAKIAAPAPHVTVVALDNVSTDPAADPGSTGEVMLDIDVAGALAPGAHIVCYFSTFDEKGMIDAIAAAISDTVNKPGVISISWGWDENQPFQNGILWSPAAIDHVNHSFLAAAQMGISICVSTGDAGSEAQVNEGLAHVNFPARSPYVLAVGGTTLHASKTAGGKVNVQEVVWNDGPGSGTGGGVSDYTPRPDWQAGVAPPSINPGAFIGRGIPDVAADADPATGYLTMSGGKLGVVGGTSASAPLWAALIARLNTALGARVGNFNALLYTKYGPAGVLRDITVGNNDTEGRLHGQYPAGPGWDACTGWGVPDGVRLLTALRG